MYTLGGNRKYSGFDVILYLEFFARSHGNGLQRKLYIYEIADVINMLYKNMKILPHIEEIIMFILNIYLQF